MAYLMTFIAWLGITAIHIWTLMIAYNNNGLLAAVITFILVGLSEIYWVYQAWQISGFDSPYIQWTIVFIIVYISQYVLVFIGSFLEARANKRASPNESEIDANNQIYIYGFGGWLYVMTAGMIITFVISVFYFIDTLLPLYQTGKVAQLTEQNALWGISIIIETVMYIFYIIYPVYLAYLCLKMKKIFIQMTILFYVMNLFFPVLFYFLCSALPGIQQSLIDQQVSTIFRSLILAVVWIPYLNKSKRIKNTYVL